MAVLDQRVLLFEMTTRPEAWQRGPVAGIPDQLQPVAHALIGAAEDAADATGGLTTAQIWLSPGGAASVGFHLMHLAGSTDRLFMYARGEGCRRSKRMRLWERALSEPRPTAEALLRGWQETVARALDQLARTADADLGAPRGVGRMALPSNVRGLLFHAAEHATRHVGQIITTAKIITGMERWGLIWASACGPRSLLRLRSVVWPTSRCWFRLARRFRPEDVGAYPHEGCVYREWVANAPVDPRLRTAQRRHLSRSPSVKPGKSRR